MKSGEGLLLQTLNEIEIECLPTEIPSNITVDAEKLTEVGQAIHVKNLKVGEKVEIKNEPEEVVVTVQTAEMKEEEPEPEVSPEKLRLPQKKVRQRKVLQRVKKTSKRTKKKLLKANANQPPT